MTPQELKHSILQLAIQGKLVEQRPEEGTAEELYREIQAEKQRLIKAGKIKKEKPLPEITDEEKPFDIPESWMWVRLGAIGYTNIGLTYSPKDITADGTIVLRSSNIQDGEMDYTDVVRVNMEIPESKLCHRGDILICARNGSKRLVGKAAMVDNEGMSFGAFMAIFRSPCNEYVLQVINSAYFRDSMRGDTGTTTINQITQDMLKNAVVPLPPFAEQERIVAKIEELLPYIDRYEQAWSRVEDFNKRFPDDMKKSILQLAIQGRIVEQRPEEGTAEELYQQIQAEKQQLIKAGKIKKEKPLPEIAEDEKPFDIPKSWKWVRLRSLGTFSSGKTPTMGVGENWNNGTVSWITSKDMKQKYLNSSEMLITEKAAREMKMYPANTILMVVRSGILKRLLPVAILTGESTINQDIKALSLYMPVIAEYVYAILKGMETHILKEYRKQVTTVDSLRFEDFQNMPVPLPPLAEQKRIVEKLEELLPLCEKMK